MAIQSETEQVRGLGNKEVAERRGQGDGEKHP